jgi:hypothetical protein
MKLIDKCKLFIHSLRFPQGFAKYIMQILKVVLPSI